MAATIARLFRFQVEHFLASGIRTGTLTLREVDAAGRHLRTSTFGTSSTSDELHAVLEVPTDRAASFYARVLTQADIGFAEAYIAGDVHTPDLLAVFRVLITNRDSGTLSSTPSLAARAGALVNTALHSLHRNNTYGAARNIRAHYDLSNALFATFLGRSWVYSSAIFDDEQQQSERDMHSDQVDAVLYEAQLRKIRTVLHKARVRKGDTLLDIGCGWAELAIVAATEVGCHVVGITLSDEQLTLGRKRVKDAQVQHLVTLRLVDYRDLATEGVQYDAVVSVEMVEAVGHEYLPDYFRAIDAVLRPGGLAVVQVITTPDARYAAYRSGADFIQKHIFPGGLCPSLGALVDAAACTTLQVEEVHNYATHYATTLRLWRRTFTQAAKLGKVKEAGEQFDEQFVRKWIYYLVYCEAGFASRTLGLLHVVLSRTGNVDTLGAPPLLS